MTRDTATIIVMAPPAREAKQFKHRKKVEAFNLIELAPELTCATKEAGKIREREREREYYDTRISNSIIIIITIIMLVVEQNGLSEMANHRWFNMI